jgi:hypothetical protein
MAPAVKTRAAEGSAARLERRRQQCRRSQRRYRDKQGSEEYNLVLDVNGLRERVEHLKNARDVLRSRLWSSRQALGGTAAKAARQYYVVFARGLHDPESGGACVRQGFELQRGFARAFFDEDVHFGDGVGVDAVLEQWRRYSQFHATLRIQYLDAEVVGPAEAPIVIVRGRLVVRLSRRTIENVFPHVLPNEPLVQALIGQRVEYPTSTAYAFNERVQVVRQELSVDFLEGLNALLHDTMAASHLLQRARIVDSCRFDEVTEDYFDVHDEVVGDDYVREMNRRAATPADTELKRDIEVKDEGMRQEKLSARLNLSFIMS